MRVVALSLYLPLLSWPWLTEAVTLSEKALQSPVSSFVSEEGSYCAESNPRQAESALALKKSGPLGKLFSTVVATLRSCSSEGYSLAAGEDPSYPNLQFYFASAAARDAWPAVEARTLARFAQEFELQQETVRLMVNCTSHPDSSAAKAVAGQCSSLDSIQGAWMHVDPADGTQLICDGGPYTYATFALASIKSSTQLPMHPRDQCTPKSCTELGYTFKDPPEDHCYPRLHVYTRTKDMGTDLGIQRSQAVEAALPATFSQFADQHGVNQEVLGTTLGCNCLPSSSVGMGMADSDLCQAKRPPVNDWWVGQLP